MLVIELSGAASDISACGFTAVSIETTPGNAIVLDSTSAFSVTALLSIVDVSITLSNIDFTKGFDFEKIVYLDKDWELFKSVYEQPVFTDEQKKNLEDNLSNFESWLIDKIKK